MATQKLGFFEIMSDAGKVFKLNYSHFLTLSALVNYPFILFLLAFRVLQLLQNTNIPIPQFPSSQDSISLKHVIFFVLYAFTLLTLYIVAIATTTYSSYHVIFSHPVKIVDSIKSLSKSFIRLFATFFCALTIIFAGLLAVGLIIFGFVKGFEHLGFQIDFVVLKFMLGIGLFYLCVYWVLAPVIVVVETSWGLEPLRRSAYLVKGGRGVIVFLMFCIYVWLRLPAFGVWESDSFIGMISDIVTCVLNSVCLMEKCLMLLLLYSFIIYTVLYMKCKVLHGEEIEEFGQEYVSLPLDEEDVPHFASADQPKID